MWFWVIVDAKGNIVMESNRKVPRMYVTRPRAEEKIKALCMWGKWKACRAELVVG